MHMKRTSDESETEIAASRPEQAPPPLEQTSDDASTTTLRASALGNAAGVAAFGLLVAWLLLFGAGIMVDTEPYRAMISPAGVEALKSEGGAAPAADTSTAAANTTAVGSLRLLAAWAIVLTAFLPLNLAWLCVASSTLGAFGSLANLSSDEVDSASADMSNPFLSAVLRGFFVFLFMMSGLLLLDDAPFSNAGPGQYIRLAGFLSLFSFIVSYQPRLFSALVTSAFQRIQVRGGDEAVQSKQTNTDTVRTTVDVGVAVESESTEPARSNRLRE